MEILHWSNGDVMAVLSILWTCLDDINSKYFLYESGLQAILLAKQKSGSLNFPSTYFMPIKKIKVNAESTPGMTLERQSKCLYQTVMWMNICIRAVQLLSCVQFCATPWTAARQASLSITNSWSLLKLMSIALVMPSNYLILCCPLLLPPSILPSIRVFSNESVLYIRWPKYWSFSFISVLPMNIQD